MSDRFNQSHAAEGWSQRIADRYKCVLSDDLADWFDREIWRQTGRGEFREPVDVETLLAESPECIWPGLMSCDLIPLISNTAGDWLCVRISPHNSASQIVQWYHGGGDWIPWGESLSEAIVFDALVDRLPGASRRHAVPAESPRPTASHPEVDRDPLLAWAVEHVPQPVADLFNRDNVASPTEIVDILLGTGVSEIALRCELVLADLMQNSRSLVALLEQQGYVDQRQRLSEWTFDVDRIPADAQDHLRRSGHRLDTAQDWDAAVKHCQRVTELAPDLSWAWEILGYTAERSGDYPSAISHYLRGSECSVFTDQSIRLETHWLTDQAAKFAAARLAQIAPDRVEDSAYLKLVCSPEIHLRRPRLMSYWLERAAEFAESEDFAQSHRCYVAAGWDVGAEPINAFANLLDKVAETAAKAERVAQAEVAATHRRCLHDRYGV